jgi:hypothetical protein
MNAFRTVEAAQVVEEDEVVVRQHPPVRHREQRRAQDALAGQARAEADRDAARDQLAAARQDRDTAKLRRSSSVSPPSRSPSRATPPTSTATPKP